MRGPDFAPPIVVTCAACLLDIGRCTIPCLLIRRQCVDEDDCSDRWQYGAGQARAWRQVVSSQVDRYGQQSIDCFRTYLNNILKRPGPFTDPDSWNADVLEKAKVLSVVSNQYL